MAAKPGGLGYFKAGRPYRFQAKATTGGLGYFKAGSPFRGMIAPAATTYVVTTAGGLSLGAHVTEVYIAGPGPGGWPPVWGGPVRNPLFKEPDMNYLDDFGLGQKVNIKFPTTKADGTPITFAAGAVSVYRDDSTTETTAGVTLTIDYDGRTGFHSVLIDTAASSFYQAGHDYTVVVTSGTVNAVSAVGQVVGSFSIRNRPQLVPGSAFSTSGLKSAGG